MFYFNHASAFYANNYIEKNIVEQEIQGTNPNWVSVCMAI